MKTINIIETAKELIDFAKPTRTKGDISPFLGAAAKLIFENNYQYIQLQGAEGFQLSEKITIEDILKKALRRHNLEAHIT